MYLFSCIIPVLHEFQGINGCLNRFFRHVPADRCEVIVVDGDAEGSTICHIDYPQVKTLCAPSGRGRQMNAGARQAQGKYLIFLHADTVLPPNPLQQIQDVVDKPEYVAGAFTLRFDSNRFIFRVIGKAASWRYRLTRLPYGDQAFFMSKRYFQDIGGFAEIPIMEDIDLMRRIRKQGGSICILPEAVSTSPRRWEQEGIGYSILRTWILASLFCIGVSPNFLVRYYRNWHGRLHKDK